MKSILNLHIEPYPLFQNSEVKVLLISNGYFIFKQFEDAFLAENYSVKSLTIKHYDSIVPDYYRSLTDLIVLFKPDFIFSINFIGFDANGKLASLLNFLKIPVFCYIIDHPNYVLSDNKINMTQNIEYFMLEKSWCDIIYKDYNISSTFLPIALDERVLEKANRISSLNIKQSTGTDDIEKKYRLSFYGRTHIEFIQVYSKYMPEITGVFADFDTLIDSFVLMFSKHKNLSFDEVVKKFEERKIIKFKFDDAIQYKRFMLFVLFMSDLLGKKKILDFLAPKGIQIFGSYNWQDVLAKDNEIHKEKMMHSEVLELYSNTTINLNISSSTMPSSFNQKMLEIPILGGFVLSDYRDDYGLIYPKEYKFFKNTGDLERNISYYLEHDKERIELSAYAKDIVLKNHRYKNRIDIINDFIESKYRDNIDLDISQIGLPYNTPFGD